MRLIELYGGLAPYCLHAMAVEAERRDGRRYRREPPVSRMGNKAGFVPAVLRAFGLSRVRWSGVWLNDPDPVCHLFHLLYICSPLRDAVARRLWAWVPCPECAPERVAEALAGLARYTRDQCGGWGKVRCEECSGTGVQDARRLWERVRKASVPADMIERAAAVFLQSRSYNLTPVSHDGNDWKGASYNPEDRRCETKFGMDQPRETVASALEKLPSGNGLEVVVDVAAAAVLMQGRAFSQIPIQIRDEQWMMSRVVGVSTPVFRPDDHGGVDLDEFARRVEALADVAAQAVFLQSRSFGLKPVSMSDGRWMGLFENGSRIGPLADFKPDDGGCGSDHNVRDTLAGKLSKMPPVDGFQAVVSRLDAGECLPMGECSDCVVVLDPPYVGTSGYQHDSSRETVLSLARAWHEAGALVLIHEACGLAGELGAGWEARPAGVLRGRASTFWGEGGEREWLTFNRKPIWWPAIQQGLFA